MSLTIAGKPVGPVGYGCIPLTNYFTPIPQEQGFAVLREALSHGANFWNGGQHYGTSEWNSLHFFKAYFQKYPEDVDKVVISIKGCYDARTGNANADREGVKRSIDECLKVTNDEFKIDVFQAGRLDPDVPVEETVSAIAEYVKAGKIGGISLSECSAESIRRAAKVHQIDAVEVEVSLFETSIFTDGVAKACADLDVPIVAYSPLGRGFLTGQIRSLGDLAENDFRRRLPRFQPGNFDANLRIVDEVDKIAKKKGCTTGQVAIAWVIQQAATVGAKAIPIPGTGKPERVKENVELVQLTETEMNEINEVLGRVEVKGDRYPAQFQKHLKV